jgi:hypothetical protein
MHYTGPTYRPPYEASSLLLQVTTGCSHNACTFCSMYLDTPFAVSPREEIEADLQEVRASGWEPTRVFLVNGDAFALDADKLVWVADAIHRYFPSVQSIGAYASVMNVRSKTDADLARLAACGYSELNIGLESGLDDVLAYMNKGYTVAEALEAMARLNTAGIAFNVNIINAAAGPERIAEHAAANAALVNAGRPTLIFVSPLHVDAGSRLEGLVATGDFSECTLGEYLDEEIAFLKGLELENCTFFGLHVSNPVPVLGELPEDKERLVAELERGKAQIPAYELDSHPYKGAEGRIYR